MMRPILGALISACLISTPIMADVVINKRISTGNDDVEERIDGSMYLNSSDIELVYDGSKNQTIGLRFQDLTIPQGAIITTAYVQFTVDETNSAATSVTIRAQDTDSASAFTNSDFNVSSRLTTSESVSWQPANWSSVGAAGNDQRTPEMKSIIQEVVNRSGWLAGNELALIITGSGERTAESYNGSSSKAALLHIEYADDGSGGNNGGGSQSASLNKRISSSLDDVEQNADGDMYTNSSDIELVNDGSDQTIGLRFTNIQIPQGSVIDNAYIQFTTDESNSGSTSVTIQGENVNDAPAFTNVNNNVTNRSLTNAAVNWQPPAWTVVGAAGSDQQTPSLTNIVQEIVNRGGWQGGNDMAFVIAGQGERTAESFDGSSSQAPLLHIDYQTDGNNNGGGNQGEGVKIAFIGDTGADSNFQSVLNLIQSEGADFTLVAGDTSYNSSKDDNWDAMVRNTLGSDPALIAAGNHDYGDSNIADVIAYGINRLNNQSNLQCSGSYAEQMTCQIGNVYIVLSAIGSSGSRTDHENFINSGLINAPDNAWRVCAWHKNQRDMQAGGKSDEVGWTAYETCRQHGAIISTGHEHSYSRTHLLSDMSEQTVASSASSFTVSEGETFAFVSGLGGIGTRDQERDGDWWASIYTSTQGARYGAMFGTFFDDHADFYFKNIDGQIIDQFTVLKGY